MSALNIGFNQFYVDLFDVLTHSPIEKSAYQKLLISLLNQLELLRDELKKDVDFLNQYVEKEDGSILNDIDIDVFYESTDKSIENLQKVKSFLKESSLSEDYKEQFLQLLDDLYTLLLQLEDKISVLDFTIEPILPGDPDYETVQKVKEYYKKHPEEYMNFDEWVKTLNV